MLTVVLRAKMRIYYSGHDQPHPSSLTPDARLLSTIMGAASGHHQDGVLSLLVKRPSRTCLKTLLYTLIVVVICWLFFNRWISGAKLTKKPAESEDSKKTTENSLEQKVVLQLLSKLYSMKEAIAPIPNPVTTIIPAVKSSSMKAETAEEPKAERAVWNNANRLGVIAYMPNQLGYLKQFIALLYGSWKYIVDNVDQIATWSNTPIGLAPDLLIFCHTKLCGKLVEYCRSHPVNGRQSDSHEINANLTAKNRSPVCWWIEQKDELITPYTVLNSFVMFNRSDIALITQPYKFLLRTDIDCFLSPRIFTWEISKGLTVGTGGYCHDFNMARLKMIAKKLNMTHRGVHCVGSTWFGETKLFVELAHRTIKMTLYMYNNEFDPNAPGLEVIDFKKNREGEWIRWWRPVSLLYGGELAANDMIPDFSLAHKQPYDASSCSKEPVNNFPHIHCWHNPCEFSKFTFMSILDSIQRKDGKTPSSATRNILKYASFAATANMTTQEYCTFIAWSSVAKYMTDMLTQE